MQHLPTDLRDLIAHPERYSHARDLINLQSIKKDFLSNEARKLLKARVKLANHDSDVWKKVAKTFDDRAASLRDNLRNFGWNDDGSVQLLSKIASRIRQFLGGKSLDLNVKADRRYYSGGLYYWREEYSPYDGVHLAPILEAIKKSKYLQEVKMIVRTDGIFYLRRTFLDAMKHTNLTRLDLSGSNLSDRDKDVIQEAIKENKHGLQIVHKHGLQIVRSRRRWEADGVW